MIVVSHSYVVCKSARHGRVIMRESETIIESKILTKVGLTIITLFTQATIGRQRTIRYYVHCRKQSTVFVLFIVLPGNAEIVFAILHYVIQHVVRHDRWGLGASW